MRFRMLRHVDRHYCDVPESGIAAAEAQGYVLGCMVGAPNELPDPCGPLCVPYFFETATRRTFQAVNGRWLAPDGTAFAGLS
jgi:hypothetical protein